MLSLPPNQHYEHWMDLKAWLHTQMTNNQHVICHRNWWRQFKKNGDRSPTYPADMVQPASTRSTRHLRSRESGLFNVPRLRTKFGETAFSFSGPSAWNALPTDIQDETCTAVFKRKLKTFYFSQALDCIWFYFILFHPWQFVMRLRSFSSGGTTKIFNL